MFYINKIKNYINHKKNLKKLISEQIVAYNYLKKHYIQPYALGKIPNYNFAPKIDLGTDKIIWQYWAQSINENTPDIVKFCLNSVDKYKGEYKRIILTNETVKDYIDLPDFVWAKLNNGDFSYTFFSDLLRVCLLATYGGIWIDATILLTNKIDNKFLDKEFFVFQRIKGEKDFTNFEKFNSYYFNSNHKNKVNLLSSFIISNQQNNLINMLKDILLEYWKKEISLCHYFTLHLVFQQITKTHPEYNCEKISDLLPHYLLINALKPFDNNLWQDIKNKSNIHKLTYFKEIPKNSFINKLLNDESIS